MPLTQADLEDIQARARPTRRALRRVAAPPQPLTPSGPPSTPQADAMADDVDIDLEKMSLWMHDEATAYFESGGSEEPGVLPAAAAPHPKLPKPDAEQLKLWFPKYKPVEGGALPKFRMVCFHNAGSAESIWTGKGLRQKDENPFVLHCREHGGELMACELPGREARHKEKRFRDATGLRQAAEALFPVLASYLQDGVPHVLVGHSVGTWMLFEWSKLAAERGLPFPVQAIVSGFPHPALPFAERPWSKGKGMADEAFKEECRGWSINEVVFTEGTWKVYGPMMRDDFSLFDEYIYVEPPKYLGGKFPFPIQAYWAEADKRIKEHHMKAWTDFSSVSFSLEQTAGNHLFFYDFPARAAYMKAVVAKLPAECQ